jgi:pyroglutamyl-peptidase
MGSEAAPASFIEFHITGFKKFHGVAENPTEVLVGTIEEYVRKHHGMPTGTLLGSCTVLETAGEGALGPLMELLNSSLVGIEHPSIERSGNSQELKLDVNSLPTIQKKIVWVHFGVNSGATNFAVEWRAVNEATFRCADELGWQPQVWNSNFTIPTIVIQVVLFKMFCISVLSFFTSLKTFCVVCTACTHHY